MIANEVKKRGKFRRKGALTVLRRMTFHLNQYRLPVMMDGEAQYICAVAVNRSPTDYVYLIPVNETVIGVE